MIVVVRDLFLLLVCFWAGDIDNRWGALYTLLYATWLAWVQLARHSTTIIYTEHFWAFGVWHWMDMRC